MKKMERISTDGKTFPQSVRFPLELQEKIKAAANDLGLSQAAYIRLIMALAVNSKVGLLVETKEKP